MVVRLLNIGVIATLVLAAAYVYDIKYQSTLRAERVAKLRQDIRRERDAIASLRAEWARLGNPRRIQTLAQRHLPLKPFAAKQLDSLDSLPERIPQIVQPASDDPIGAMLDDPTDLTATGSVNAANPFADVSIGKADKLR
jgi:cell division protein FtsL